MQLKTVLSGIILVMVVVAVSGCTDNSTKQNSGMSVSNATKIATDYANKYGVTPGVPSLQNNVFTVPLYRNGTPAGNISIDSTTGQVTNAYVNP
ncbi:MAG TPA: hypothetical protein VF324_06215 [Methanobacterium sp.]